ncbi:unnamed protein product [Pylaiella littoralis]
MEEDRSRLVLLKLGGSLISDKTRPEALRGEVLDRIARELREAISEWGDTTRVVVGHGSGSFGHVAAARHGTIDGVSGDAQWMGFCEVSDSAARLNRLVTAALLRAGIPAISLQPAASAVCRGGKLISLATAPIKAALEAGIVPVVHGDVAFDEELGGTVASTEEIFAFLVGEMSPRWLLLAGETEGVFGADGTCVSKITPESLPSVEESLGGSRGTDVTGGMASKVRGMLSLVESLPGTRVRIFSGLEPGDVKLALLLAADGRDGVELTPDRTSRGVSSGGNGGWLCPLAAKRLGELKITSRRPKYYLVQSLAGPAFFKMSYIRYDIAIYLNPRATAARRSSDFLRVVDSALDVCCPAIYTSSPSRFGNIGIVASLFAAAIPNLLNDEVTIANAYSRKTEISESPPFSRPVPLKATVLFMTAVRGRHVENIGERLFERVVCFDMTNSTSGVLSGDPPREEE